MCGKSLEARTPGSTEWAIFCHPRIVNYLVEAFENEIY
jgi:hypothetical protein